MLDRPVNAERSDIPDFPAVPDSLERRAPEALKETSGSLDCVDSRDWLVIRAAPDQWASLGSKEHQVIKVHKDLPDNKDNLDPSDREDLRVSAAGIVLINSAHNTTTRAEYYTVSQNESQCLRSVRIFCTEFFWFAYGANCAKFY